jgi:O-antigen/teichoic acid export membrane protein
MSAETTPLPSDAPPAPSTVGPARQSLLRSGIESWGANILGAVLSLGNVLAVSRALGPAGRGDVAFLTTMAGLTSFVAMVGVPRAIGNFAPHERDRLPAIAGTALVLSVASGTLAVVVVALLIALVPAAGGHISAALRWFALASIPMLVFQGVVYMIARTFYGHRVANLYWIAPPLINVTVNGALAATGALTVAAAFAAWVGGQLVLTVLLLVYVRRTITGFGRPDHRLGRRMLGFGLKSHLGQVLMTGNYRMDQWMVQALAGAHDLGLYSVAVAWSETIFFLPTAVQSVLRPDLVRDSSIGARRQAATVFRVCSLITLASVGALVLLAPFLCTTIFGAAFRGSVVQLRILAVGGFGIVALKLLGDALTSQSKPMLETASISVAFVLVLALDVAHIPSHGGSGAAIASAIGYTGGGVAVAFIFTRAHGGRLVELIPRATDVGSTWRRLAGVKRRSRR